MNTVADSGTPCKSFRTKNVRLLEQPFLPGFRLPPPSPPLKVKTRRWRAKTPQEAPAPLYLPGAIGELCEAQDEARRAAQRQRLIDRAKKNQLALARRSSATIPARKAPPAPIRARVGVKIRARRPIPRRVSTAKASASGDDSGGGDGPSAPLSRASLDSRGGARLC